MNAMIMNMAPRPTVKPADTSAKVSASSKDTGKDFKDILQQAGEEISDAPNQQDDAMAKDTPEALEKPEKPEADTEVDDVKKAVIALVQIGAMPAMEITAEAKVEPAQDGVTTTPTPTSPADAKAQESAGPKVQQPDFSKLIEGANGKQIEPNQGSKTEPVMQQGTAQQSANLLEVLAGKSAQNAAIVAAAAQNAGGLEQKKPTAETKAAVLASQGKDPVAKNEVASSQTKSSEVKQAELTDLLSSDLTVEERPSANGARALKSMEQMEAKAQDSTSVLTKGSPDTAPSAQTTDLKSDVSIPFNQFGFNANHAKAEAAPGVHTPQQPEPRDIRGQIVEHARMIKTTEDTQMIIKLKPEHLGELTMKVTVEKGVVSATFHSDNAQVRTMLETTLIQLKQELANQGIKVDNVGVYAGLGQFMSDGQQRNAQGQQGQRSKNRKIDLAEFEDEVEKVSAMGSNTASQDGGVDYRI